MKEKKRKKGIAKRFFSAFLALALVVTMLPISTTTVWAGGADVTWESSDFTDDGTHVTSTSPATVKGIKIESKCFDIYGRDNAIGLSLATSGDGQVTFSDTKGRKIKKIVISNVHSQYCRDHKWSDGWTYNKPDDSYYGTFTWEGTEAADSVSLIGKPGDGINGATKIEFYLETVKTTPTADNFTYDSSTGTVSAADGVDLGTVTTYYKVDDTWTTDKPAYAGTYQVGVVTTGSDTYAKIGSEAEPFTGSWTYVVRGLNKDGSVTVDETNFPDANFRDYLLKSSDINPDSDDILTKDELEAVTTMDVSNREIADLKGIEYFTKLTTLDCSSNQLTSLDVSKNTALSELNCNSNQLTSLDVSKNTALSKLSCNNNQLKFLDVSANTNLKNLDFSYNQMVAVKAYDKFGDGCYYNAKENYYDISVDSEGKFDWTTLTALGVDTSRIKNGKLEGATLSDNVLTVNKGTSEVSYEYCLNSDTRYYYVVRLTVQVEINEANFPDATFREYVKTNFDTDKDGKLSPAEIKAVTTIDVENQGITSLKGIEFFGNLGYLDCRNNQLVALDLSSNTNLRTLYATGNSRTVQVAGSGDNTDVYELTQLKADGLNTTKMSNLTGATLNDDSSALKVTYGSDVTYGYTVNESNTITFTLYFDRTVETADGEVAINVTNFPDSAFRTFVCKNYDKDKNYILSEAERDAVTSIYLEDYQKCLNLRGVEYFTKLTSLICKKIGLTELDVSKNTELTELICWSTHFKSIDLSHNKKLKRLSFSMAELETLDLSENTELEELVCDSTNLSSLDLSKNTKLEKVRVYECNYKAELDADGKIDLTTLPGSFDVTKMSDVTGAAVDGNMLTFDRINGSVKVSYTYKMSDKYSAEFTIRADMKIASAISEDAFGATAASSFETADGSIAINTNDIAMKEIQMSTDGGVTYKTISDSDDTSAELSGLSAGVYYFRHYVKGYVASDAVKVVVGPTIKYTAPTDVTYTLTASPDEIGYNGTTTLTFTPGLGYVVTEPLKLTIGGVERTFTKGEGNTYTCEITGVKSEDDLKVTDVSGYATASVGEDAPQVSVKGMESVLKESLENLLTTEEQEAVKYGASYNIYLAVEKLSDETVDSGDKKATEEFVAQYSELKEGMYLDLSLWKQVGTNPEEKIASTDAVLNSAVEVTITLPDELKAPEGISRGYGIIRVHDGVAELLPTVCNGDEITFKTDRFSTYSIWYTDEETGDNSNTNDNNNNNSNNNNSDNNNGTNGSGSGTTTVTSAASTSDTTGTTTVTSAASASDTTTDSASDSTSVKTGDNTNVVPYILLLMFAFVGFAGVYARRKRL